MINHSTLISFCYLSFSYVQRKIVLKDLVQRWAFAVCYGHMVIFILLMVAKVTDCEAVIVVTEYGWGSTNQWAVCMHCAEQPSDA